MIKSKTKYILLSLIGIFTAATMMLAGCGSPSKDDLSKDSAAGNEQTSSQRYAWPLCTASPEDTVTQLYAEKFAQEVDALSEGTMKIQVYPNSTLGGDRELLESCADGDIPFVVQNTAPQVAFLPKLAVFDLPCVFDTLEQARAAVDNEVFYSLVEKVYLQGGYKLLGYADQGFRVTTTNKRVETISDFKGQKIRTMENPYHLEFWKDLGASPTPMNFGEVYIGLQQKTITAQENPYEVIVSGKLYEQQKYLIETNHLPHYVSLIASNSFYDDLPEKQQQIIQQAASSAAAYARQQSDLRIDEKKRLIQQNGTEFIPVSRQLRQEMRKKSEPIYEEIRNIAGDELMDAYLQGR